MWLFGASRETLAVPPGDCVVDQLLNRLLRNQRILAQSQLLIIERLRLMSAHTEAFKVAFDGLLARMDATESVNADADALRNQVADLQAELDEANATLIAATEAAEARLAPAPVVDPQPEPVA
jgi:polyhydroxyalkanoate synthesis regulator phasin